MMEAWRKIPEFDKYSVSDAGRVRNDETDKILAIVRNQYGHSMVGLFDGRRQRKRSLHLLVANAFVANPERRDRFDSIIFLDGDRTNCQSANLEWRPYWFAVRYHDQFQHPRAMQTPIIETKTGDTYENAWQACLIHGLLERELILSILNRTYVWPTYQVFRFLE